MPDFFVMHIGVSLSSYCLYVCNSFGAFAWLQKVHVTIVTSICLHVSVQLSLEQIFVKFYFGDFCKELPRNQNLVSHENPDLVKTGENCQTLYMKT